MEQNHSDNILLAHEISHSLRTVDKISSGFLAVKTDMTKAFDRIEWPFLEKVLKSLGFSAEWTERIMTCVTTVSYGVLVNGKTHGHIAPSRGLRQGDPLSPFLFILCAELLANGMRIAEAQGKITGVKLSSPGPAISHLLFADDSLFFCRANTEETRELKKVLTIYERLSGQKINLSKSSITFGSKNQLALKQVIKSELGIIAEGGKGIYLGLPEAFIGSKVETLNYLEKRVAARVQSWKNRFLSLSGKETLIKAVAMSLPTYTMACFKLPKTVYAKLATTLASFWWKNQASGTGIHWSTWEKLTKPKAAGGLGFRDIEGFNLALLGKQIWRLANNPDSLLARFLKSRYYPRNSILEAKIGYRPSFGWRSIMEAQDLMKSGMKREFGNGQDISLLEDPWILNPSPRAPVLNANVDPSGINIAFITNWGSHEWNIGNLHKIFSISDVKAICKTPITSSKPTHRFSWLYTPHGSYSVKSGYWHWWNTLKHSRSITNCGKQVIEPSLNPLFSAAWKVKGPPKIQNFIWRCLSGSLAVGETMAKRKLLKTPDCPRCGFDLESINHILFQCGFARVVWASSSLGYLFYPTPADSIFSNLASCLFMQVPQDNELIYRLNSWPWVLWRLWKARNDLCFSNINEDARCLVSLAEADCKSWMLANLEITSPQPAQVQCQNRPLRSWTKPPNGYLKCNVDGSWKEGDLKSGVGWVLRDSNGDVRWYGQMTFPTLHSPLDIEAASLTWAMGVIDNLGFSNVIFELDCRSLIQAIKDPGTWPKLSPFTAEIGRQWRFLCPHFSLVAREANSSADFLAKHARFNSVYVAEVSCIIPTWLRPHLYSSSPSVMFSSIR